MGQTLYFKGALTESMRSFNRILKLEPGWYNLIDSLLDKIDEKLNEVPGLVL